MSVQILTKYYKMDEHFKIVLWLKMYSKKNTLTQFCINILCLNLDEIKYLNEV